MAQNIESQPPGAYMYDEIDALAQKHFPDVYNALLDVDDVPWERPDYDRVGFSSHSLFLGNVVLDNITYKASAYMTSQGNIQFFRRNISLSRRDNERLSLVSLWAFLDENSERPSMDNLKALCGFYFVAAGYAEVVNAKKGWFRDLKMACTKVGLGLGALVDEPAVSGLGGEAERNVERALSSHDGDVEDNGDSGDETDVTVGPEMRGLGAGVDEVKVAHILQRLLIVVKTKQESWGEQIEAELKWAWPNYKKYWR
ncbi:uncharacterized protein J4E87_005900 [Alternaria ethzedia]|uniref:uncharacterized protein n=1 Tax=Alternaria ethzedia TaxID=181014 RepID=UPI0020C20956|nr:uncharacterized protein J4E87_005900 [Alternaria ethzedia]KAI4622807.1 hypothetical protein J4E87_005900 [Alternaria ethzedia]